MTDLLETFLDEGDCEHAVLNADTHELGWISTDVAELDTVLVWSRTKAKGKRLTRKLNKSIRKGTYPFDPFFVLAVRSDANGVALGLEAFCQSDVCTKQKKSRTSNQECQAERQHERTYKAARLPWNRWSSR